MSGTPCKHRDDGTEFDTPIFDTPRAAINVAMEAEQNGPDETK